MIGSRARNWPIRDGKDQARLIASSSAVGSQTNGLHDQNEKSTTNKPIAPSRHVTGDPHASLSLFVPQVTNRDTSHHPAAVAPRVSAKPPPRDYQELFAGNEWDSSPAENAGGSSPQKDNKALKAQSARPPPRDYHDLFVGNESDASPAAKSKQVSPQKENRPITPGSMVSKGGAGKNYQPSRLFETGNSQGGTPGTPVESDKFIKPHPKKYNHFELGEGNEDAGTGRGMATRQKTKHQSQWDFEDFMTPEKVPQKIRGQDVRHFGLSDDEPHMESPMKHPNVHRPRPDARPHFEFQDDGTPAGDRRPAGHSRGQGGLKGMGLYKNDLFDEAERSPERKSHPLATVTNVQDRRNVLEPHFILAVQPPTRARTVMPSQSRRDVSRSSSLWARNGKLWTTVRDKRRRTQRSRTAIRADRGRKTRRIMRGLATDTWGSRAEGMGWAARRVRGGAGALATRATRTAREGSTVANSRRSKNNRRRSIRRCGTFNTTG